MRRKYRTVIGSEQRARCPECGAMIPLIGSQWLAAHREGVVEFSYRPGSGARCAGSLLLTRARGATPR